MLRSVTFCIIMVLCYLTLHDFNLRHITLLEGKLLYFMLPYVTLGNFTLRYFYVTLNHVLLHNVFTLFNLRYFTLHDVMFLISSSSSFSSSTSSVVFGGEEPSLVPGSRQGLSK